MASLLSELNNELAFIVEKTRPTLVQVRNGGKRSSGGAGVVWQANGLIITNAHVVAPSKQRGKRPSVTLADGSDHAANIVAFDRELDLAALQVEQVELEAAAVGDSAELKSGDWVTAIGHPYGVLGAATSGAVIAVAGSPEIAYPGDLVQVGLHMRPGHSGGPMVNNRGEVIGINCMIAGPDVGLAIPSNTVKRFLMQRFSA